MNTVMNKQIRMGAGVTVLAVFLCVGMFVGCKDLFHPEGPEEKAEDRSPPSASSTPSTPTSVSASAESSSSIRVSWGSVSGANGYNVYRADSSYGSYSSIASTSNTSSYTDTGLSVNTTYYYKVSAYNSYGASSQSNYTYATTSETLYTVTFDADGGSPATQTRTVTGGGSLGSSNMPSEPTRSGYTFNGWYSSSGGNGDQFTGSTTVTASITVYAKWSQNTPNQYTITFDADGGSPATQTRTVTSGAPLGSSNMPSEPTRSGYIFEGWYTSYNGGGSEFTGSTTVTEAITVYAKWKSFDDLSLDDALTWISGNAANGGTYTITLKNDETIAPKSLSYSGKTVGITIKGGASERTVSLSTTGWLFYVESGVTLTLDNNVTLQGRSGNTSTLVRVGSGGKLEMNSGSKITGNSYYSPGGGVSVGSNGTFTMSGGEISGNSSSSGGGVYVSGTFTMSGGEISGNSSSSGGGVYVDSNGTFAMSAGEISGNSSSYGGGVDVASNGTFTMSAGEISGNTASYYGGGVYIYNSTFTMSGGEISGNSASYYGGGVYVNIVGTFTKQSGGVIYGSDASSTLRNTVGYGDSYGHAVYISSSPAKKRNTTASTGVTLNSAVSGSTGGWE